VLQGLVGKDATKRSDSMKKIDSSQTWTVVEKEYLNDLGTVAKNIRILATCNGEHPVPSIVETMFDKVVSDKDSDEVVYREALAACVDRMSSGKEVSESTPSGR